MPYHHSTRAVKKGLVRLVGKHILEEWAIEYVDGTRNYVKVTKEELESIALEHWNRMLWNMIIVDLGNRIE